MADIKWIKIATDIFEDEKMVIIDLEDDRDTIMIIWFKLLCMAGKYNNKGVFTIGGKPYTPQLLAKVFSRPVNSVKRAMAMFKKYGMIKIENGVITIPNWEKHQQLEAYEKKKERDRLYQAERRSKLQKSLQKSSDVDAKIREDKIREDEIRGEEIKEDKIKLNDMRVEESKEDKTNESTEALTDFADATTTPTQEKFLSNSFYSPTADTPYSTTPPYQADADKEAILTDDSAKENEPTDKTGEGEPIINLKGKVEPIFGCGQGIVKLSREQVGELIEIMGEEEYNHYLDRLATFIKERGARIKSHYKILLKWYTEDTKDEPSEAKNYGLKTGSDGVKASGVQQGGKSKEKPLRYGNFDPLEAMRVAIERSGNQAVFEDE